VPLLSAISTPTPGSEPICGDFRDVVGDLFKSGHPCVMVQRLTAFRSESRNALIRVPESHPIAFKPSRLMKFTITRDSTDRKPNKCYVPEETARYQHNTNNGDMQPLFWLYITIFTGLAAIDHRQRFISIKYVLARPLQLTIAERV